MIHTTIINWMFKVGPPTFSFSLVAGLTYITTLVRSNEGQSTWMFYLIPLQLLVNWVQFLRYRSYVPVSIDNYPGYVHLRCIYILDHHCFFLGHCVGRRNQRFFLVFCFYAAAGCAVGVYHVFYVLSHYRVFWSQEIIYYFLPYSLVMAFLGRIYLLETLYVGYLNFGFGAFLMTWFLFFIGIVSVIRGSTNYEARKQLIEEDDEMPILSKIRLVFGSYGLLHFLVPVLPINNNEAVCEPGYRRLLGPRYT